MKMRISYSSSANIKQEKTIVFMDPIKGPIRCISNIIHKFKLAQVGNCGSLVSFIQINPTTFISARCFVQDIAGYYVITFNNKEEIVEHKALFAEVNMVPVVRKVPDDAEEWRFCHEIQT